MKDLVKWLKRDSLFRYDCGVLYYDKIPAESSYSGMIATISESDAMVHIHDQFILLAITEGYLGEEIFYWCNPLSDKRMCERHSKEGKTSTKKVWTKI